MTKKVYAALVLALFCLPLLAEANTCLLKQSTALSTGMRMGPFLDETDGKTAETALTLSQADVRLSKAEGAFAQKNESTSCTHLENGWYKCPLDATDTNTLGLLVVAIHESGALPVWKECMVLPATVYDALVTNAVGAAGGLFGVGTNASLAITGALTVGGGIAVTQSSANTAGVSIAGNGSGSGAAQTAVTTTVTIASNNTGNFNATGGSGGLGGNGSGGTATGGATGHGIIATGGSTSGSGIIGTANAAGTGHGISGVSYGSGNGGLAGSSGTSGGVGMSLIGTGTGAGLNVAAGATGVGVTVTTTAGDGVSVTPTAGNALVLTANGTSKHGMKVTGGTAGTSHGALFTAGSGGKDLQAATGITVDACTGCSSSGGTTLMPDASYVKASTNVIHEIFIRDSSTLLGKTGLTFASASLVIGWGRADQGNNAFTTCTPATATLGSYTSCGFKEKDATNAAGVYELGLTTAMLATGADEVTVQVYGVSGTTPTILKIGLVDVGLAAVNTKLGTPAGASMSADTAAVKTVVDATKAKTDSLNFSGSNVLTEVAA